MTRFSITRIPGFRQGAPISGMQVAAQRIGLGLYLVCMGWVFAHLATPDYPGRVVLNWGLPVLGLVLVTGRLRPLVAVLAGLFWGVGMIWLDGNPYHVVSFWLPQVGTALFVLALIPPGDGLCLGQRLTPDRDWVYPEGLHRLLWLLVAVAAGLSTVLRLSSPTWREGEGLSRLLTLDGMGGTWLATWLQARDHRHLLAPLSYAAIGMQALIPPLCITRQSRFVAWFFLLCLGLAALALGIGVDHGLGLLVLVTLLFDPRWVQPVAGPAGGRLLLFDGVCGLCNRFVWMLLQEDHARRLSFASLQSATGQATLQRHLLPSTLDSLVYVQDPGGAAERTRVKSDAVLGVFAEIGGFWRLLSWLRLVPRPLRDWCYDRIAANRYRIWGQYDSCPLPEPEQRARFVDL